MRKEKWLNIYGFEDYLVSDMGRVINSLTDKIKQPTLNQQGIPSVLLVRDKIQYRRSVALLVADAFLECPDDSRNIFDTPINLNGDRLDNRVDNLLWRPRWFAVKFHKERKDGNRNSLATKFIEVESEEIFEQPWQAAIRWGLLEGDIIKSIMNDEPVFPTWQQFEFYYDDDLRRY